MMTAVKIKPSQALAKAKAMAAPAPTPSMLTALPWAPRQPLRKFAVNSSFDGRASSYCSSWYTAATDMGTSASRSFPSTKSQPSGVPKVEKAS